MTTIAYDGKYLAVDSQLTCDNTFKVYQNKLWKFNHGVFTVTGEWTDYPEFQAMLNDEKQEAVVSKKCLCIFARDGKVYEWWPRHKPMQMVKRCAQGSGKELAVGAMYAGATAIEAVRIATRLDPFSGGKVNWVEV